MQVRTLYRLGTRIPDAAGSMSDWPYGVDYEPAKAERPFLLWEGLSPTEVGGEYSAGEILASAVFRDHLALAGVEWLRPCLERLAGGEMVAEAEILAAHFRVHRRAPEIIRLAAY